MTYREKVLNGEMEIHLEDISEEEIDEIERKLDEKEKKEEENKNK